jgi:hypothetical protein
MRHSFAPFGPYEARFLSHATSIDYSRVDFASPRWLCVAGYDDKRALMGLCCFEFVSWFEAYFNIAILDPRCITRRIMRAMFTAAFTQAVRITAEVEPGNDRAIRQAQLMGFEIEGFKRLAIEGRRDAILLGMTKDTCRYLRARPRGSLTAKNENFDGQLTQAS